MTSAALTEPAIAIRTLVALMYLTAALGKLRHWGVFHGVVANYRLLPDFLVAPVAYGLPPVEAMLGLTLMAGFAPGPAALAAAGLLLVFALAMGINIRRGRRHIDCGCFQSALRQSLNWTLVIRNAVLALLLGLTVPWGLGPPTMRGATDVRTTLEGVLAGAVLFVILQSLVLLWSIVPAWQRPAVHGSGIAR